MKHFYIFLFSMFFLVSANYSNGQKVSIEWQKHGIKEKYNILSKEFARINIGRFQGIIDQKGDTVLHALHTSIHYDSLGFFILADKNNRTGVINKKGQPIIPFVYDQIQILREGFQAYKDSELVFFNFDGKEEKHPIYNKYQIRSSNSKLLVASLDGYKWGVLDNNGIWIVPNKYSDIDIRNPNFIIYKNGQKAQIRNSQGDVIDSNKYYQIEAFGEYYFAKSDSDLQYSGFDSEGNKLIDVKSVDKISYEGNFVILINGSSGSSIVYDQKMNQVFEGESIDFLDVAKNLLTAGEHQKKALYNNFIKVTGNMYRDFNIVEDKIVAVGKDGIDILNEKGDIIKSFRPNIAIILSGLRVFNASGDQINDSLYIYDQDKYIKIDPFTSINSEDPNFFVTRNYGKSNLYDKNFNLVIKDVDRLDYLKRENPYFIYRINNQEGFITLEGKTEPIYDELLTYDGNIFFVLKLNEWRILKNDGKPYNTEIYTNLDGNNSNFAIMKNKGELQYFSIKQNSFKDFGKILDYKVGLPSSIIALKIENRNWLLYNASVDSFLLFTFDSLSYTAPFLDTNLGKYYYSYKSSSFEQLPLNYVPNINNHIIKLQNGTYYVELYNYLKKQKYYTKSFKCDSLSVLTDYVITFSKEKQSLYSIKRDTFIFTDANSIRENYDYLILTTYDSIYLFLNAEKVASFAGQSPRMLAFNRLVSFTNKNEKFIFDINLEKIIKARYDIYNPCANGFYFVENNLKIGLIDKFHNEIIPPIYDNLTFNNKYLQGYLAQKTCLLDTEGNICIPLDKYYNSFSYSRGLIFAKLEGHYGIYNSNEKKWYPASKYQDIKDCNIRLDGVGDIYIFRENGHYGLMNDRCIALVSPEYDEINIINDYLYLHKSERIYFYNAKANTVSTQFYNRIEHLKNYWVGISNDSISIYDRFHLKCKFKGNFFDSFYGKNQICFQHESGSKGVYDVSKCKVILTPNYHLISGLSNGGFLVEDLNSKGLVLSPSGKIVYTGKSLEKSDKVKDQNIKQFRKIIEKFEPMNNKWLKVNVGDKFGIIDLNGTIKLPIIYDDFSLSDDYDKYNYSFKRGEFIDVYSLNLELICSGNFDYIGQFRHGLAAARKGVKWGYIDLKCKEVTPLKFDYCDEFNASKYAVVAVDSSLKIIDVNGILRNASYADFSSFSSKKASKLIFDSGNFNKINYQNLNCDYEYFYSATKMACTNKLTGKIGVYDIFYNEVIPPLYDDLFNVDSNRIVYIINNKYGLLDSFGKKITEPIYDKILFDYGPNLKASKDGHSFLIDMNGVVIE